MFASLVIESWWFESPVLGSWWLRLWCLSPGGYVFGVRACCFELVCELCGADFVSQAPQALVVEYY